MAVSCTDSATANNKKVNALEKATTMDAVCNWLKEQQQQQVENDDESTTISSSELFMEKVWELMKDEKRKFSKEHKGEHELDGLSEESCRQLYEYEGSLDLILACMTAHPEHVTIQEQGCKIFLELQNQAYIGYKKGQENPLISFFVSDPCMEAVLEAMETHAEHAKVVEPAMVWLGNMKQCILNSALCEGMMAAENYPTLRAYVTVLEEKKALPLCFSLLKHHATNNEIVAWALTVLQLPVGGEGRPVLKAMMKETPDLDQILERVVEGTDADGYASRELWFLRAYRDIQM